MQLFRKLKNTISQSIQFQQDIPNIVNIAPNLYHIPYPKSNIITSLKKQILSLNDPVIYNISQYTYQKELFGQQIRVKTFNHQYFTSLPLCTMLHILKQIKYKIQTQNVNVFIHCQDNNSRSAILLVIYLYLYQKYEVTEAIVQINKLLKIDTQRQTLFPTQHTFLKNIINYCIQPQIINKKQLRLLRLIVDRTPIISGLTSQSKVLIQIKSYRDSKPIFRQLFPPVSQTIGFNFLLQKYNIKLSDDFLISIKYVENNKIYPILRVQLNTNFIHNKFSRVQPQQMDISPDTKTQGLFLDLIFVEQVQTSDLSLLQPPFGKKKQQQVKVDIQKQLIDLREQVSTIVIDNFQIDDQDEKQQYGNINEQMKNKLKIIQNLINANVDDKDEDEDDEDYFRNLENSD